MDAGVIGAEIAPIESTACFDDGALHFLVDNQPESLAG